MFVIRRPVVRLAHQTDPTLDLAVIIRVVMDVDKVTTVQFYIPSDDLGIELGVGRIVSVNGYIAIGSKNSPVDL